MCRLGVGGQNVNAAYSEHQLCDFFFSPSSRFMEDGGRRESASER